jgi:hypothetical protein
MSLQHLQGFLSGCAFTVVMLIAISLIYGG